MLNLKRMTLPDRDRRVVQAVGRFRQLTASHIHELVFFNLASRTPCDRTLKRLVTSDYLTRVESSRVIGGKKGGAGQYAYQLGKKGHLLLKGPALPYRPGRRVDYHQLLMADSYLSFLRMHRKDALKMQGMAIDEASWTTISGIDLRPDLLLDLMRPDAKRFLLWVEVDMATEGKKQILEKLERYWEAALTADSSEWPLVPRCVWIACDDERANELRWFIQTLHDDGRREYFKVATLADLAGLFLN